MKKIFALLLSVACGLNCYAQLSNAQIMEIKDNADDGKSLWIKYFEEGFAKNTLTDLSPLRKTNEEFLTGNISKLGRMTAEGDGRELLTAVRNYLVIQKQFVKDVMVPAESLKPGDNDTYEMLSRKISESAEKERSFLIDINNALRLSPDPVAAEAPEPEEPEEQELSEEEIKKREEAKPRHKGKLPHETYNEGKKKRKQKDEDEE
jgi:hypothetical protein